MIFVFGSNLAGRHGRGAASHALKHYGAVYGVGQGRTGNSYALPTKDAELRPLPLTEIRRHVARFIAYATQHPEQQFEVTSVGTGYAGYTPHQIAPMFEHAPANCQLSDEFRYVLGRK